MSAEEPVFPVAFDELAMAEDLARLGEGGVEALQALGRELDRLGAYLVGVYWPAKRKAATGRNSAAASRHTSRGRQADSEP